MDRLQVHQAFKQKKEKSGNEKIRWPSAQTRVVLHFVGAGHQEGGEEMEEKEDSLNTSEVLSVQPWQGPPHRGVRAAHPAKAMHKFGHKLLQIRTSWLSCYGAG